MSIEVIGASNYNLSLQLIDARGARGDGVLAAVEDGCQVCTINEASEALSRAAAALHQKAPVEEREHLPAPVVVAAPAAPPRALEVPGYIRGLAIASIVVGALGIGSGLTLILLDGHVSAKGENYEDKLHTLAAGVAAASVGGALVITSGILFGYDHSRRHRAFISPVVGPRGAGARLSFDF